jgi:uncharacterized iron-regulated membrane protein
MHAKKIDVDPSIRKVVRIDDPNTGWLSVISALHYHLLLPSESGFLINGIGAIALLLLAISGAVLWWPGLRSWKRGFLVDFRWSFKRITRDLHNVVGLLALTFIGIWSLSGQILSGLNRSVRW